MSLRYLIISLLIVTVISNCGERKDSTSKDSLDNVPESIQGLENLVVNDFDKDPPEKIEFNKAQDFGEIYIQLLAPTMGFGPSIAVAEDERLFRAGAHKTSIEVYNTEGEKIDEIGRQGRGPGEFERVDAVYIFNEKLFVYDSNLVRLTIFSLKDFKLLEVIKIETQWYSDVKDAKIQIPRTVIPFTENSLMIALSLDGDVISNGYFLVDSKGKLVSEETILRAKRIKMHSGRLTSGGLAGISLPFSSKSLLAFSGSRIYITNSKEIAIQVLDSEGKNEQTIYYSFENDPLEEQEVLDTFHPNLHSVVKSAEYSETWPALDNLLVDDKGRIWIAKIVDDKTIHQWSIIEPNGKLKASFEWPAEHSIKIIKNGKIYVEETDLEVLSKHLKSYEYEFSNF